MADDPTKHAIDVVAARVMTDLTKYSIGDAWGLYPEIGEGDWLAVQSRVAELTAALRPADDRYGAAYEHLEFRASQTDEGVA